MAEFRDINSLPLAPSTISSLLQHGFRVVEDVCTISPIDLSQECSLSLEISVQVIEAAKSCKLRSEINPHDQQPGSSSGIAFTASQSISHLSSQVLATENIFTAKDLISKWSSLKPIITFCKEIDTMLGGGIPLGQITEICGVPGVNIASHCLLLFLISRIFIDWQNTVSDAVSH